MSDNPEIKVGDDCFIGSSYHGYQQDKVARETKTQWVLESGDRYRKDTLRRVGDHYGSQLHPYSKEIADRIILSDKQSKLSGLLYDLSVIRNHANVTDIKELDEMISQLSSILERLKKTRKK